MTIIIKGKRTAKAVCFVMWFFVRDTYENGLDIYGQSGIMVSSRTGRTTRQTGKGMTMDIKIDTARGFDVMRGTQVLEHFDTYEQAWQYAEGRFGVVVRYWVAKE